MHHIAPFCVRCEKMNAARIANVTLRLLIGGIFIFSAAAKTFRTSPDELGQQTIYSRWVRAGSRTDVAIAAAELLLGLWMILGRFPRVAACFCAAVLLFYTVFLVMEIQSNAPLPCGCFWVTPDQASPPEIRRQLMIGVSRNLLLILSCAIIFFWRVDPPPDREPEDGSDGAEPSKSAPTASWRTRSDH
jgi:uncharacterized membrane protein YphA (DoxX/SURF4 family)